MLAAPAISTIGVVLLGPTVASRADEHQRRMT